VRITNTQHGLGVISSRIPIKNSIVTQLLKAVFFFYLVLTFVMTIVHLTIEFHKTAEDVNFELSIKAQIYKDSISESMWSYNQQQLDVIFGGVVKDPMILKVCVFDEKGVLKNHYPRQLNEKGAIFPPDESSFLGRALGTFDIAPYAFEVRFKRGSIDHFLGKVEFFPEKTVIFKKMEHTVYLILSTAIVKTMFFWVLFFLLSKKILRRPLEILTRELEDLDPNLHQKKEVDLAVTQQNELKLLEATFNDLLEKLYETSHQVRERDAMLQRYNLELEDLVEKRTKEIQSTVLLKDVLLKTLCHDLSNPMKGVVGWIRMMKKGEAEDSQTNRTTVYDAIESCWSMLSAVNEMKRSIDLNNLNVQGHSLRRLVEQSLVPLKSELLKRKVTPEIQIHQDLIVQVDDNYFSYSVLCNIFHNAIKFSPIGSCLYVKALIQENILVIEIIDEGKGIQGRGYSSEDMLGAKVMVEADLEGDKGSGTGLQQVAFFAALFHFNVELVNRKERPGAVMRLKSSKSYLNQGDDHV
jgi:signal transduction histidine kinase